MKFRRKLPDVEWSESIADLLINLSAGWFGAIVIVPNFTGAKFPLNLILLIADLFIGIISLIIAVRLKKLIKNLRERK